MNKQIAIIGLGALGRRHLESLFKSEIPFEVYCVDVNEHALNGFDKILYRGHNVVFGTDVGILPKKLDWVLFAMTSKGRREMFDAVAAVSEVSSVVFEKVLFQRIEDYEHVARVLSERQIKAWVNCARREQVCWQNLRERMSSCKCFEVHVSGSEWGLACNAIHMMDAVEFISDGGHIELVDVNLEDRVADSKRPGFKEVYGCLSGHCGRCRNFSISCSEGGAVPLQIDVVTDQFRCRIEESKGRMTLFDSQTAFSGREIEFKLKYQSQLTQLTFEEIMGKGKCWLPTYDESMRIHLQLLRPLIKFFEKQGMEESVCPIT